MNFLQIAILRWYHANLTASFAAGPFPFGLAFDGANIWVANNSANTVSRLRACDGANLGTFEVGTFPEGVAFDGANIWVTNFGGNSVTWLRGSDGTNLGTFATGTGPEGVACGLPTAPILEPSAWETSHAPRRLMARTSG